nr:hypothetical transcript [Hymenolepis microstoma]
MPPNFPTPEARRKQVTLRISCHHIIQ